MVRSNVLPASRRQIGRPRIVSCCRQDAGSTPNRYGATAEQLLVRGSAPNGTSVPATHLIRRGAERKPKRRMRFPLEPHRLGLEPLENSQQLFHFRLNISALHERFAHENRLRAATGQSLHVSAGMNPALGHQNLSLRRGSVVRE